MRQAWEWYVQQPDAFRYTVSILVGLLIGEACKRGSRPSDQ